MALKWTFLRPAVLSRKDAFFLASTSTIDSWDVFIGSSRSILTIFFALGISPGDLGSHSARKGSSSHASSGTTVSPPMVSICLRAMWSMGHVKERYLQFEKAGDQYLGRVVCGLDVNDV